MKVTLSHRYEWNATWIKAQSTVHHYCSPKPSNGVNYNSSSKRLYKNTKDINHRLVKLIVEARVHLCMLIHFTRQEEARFQKSENDRKKTQNLTTSDLASNRVGVLY